MACLLPLVGSVSAQKASDCITCHPGSTKGLGKSVHRSLLGRADSCSACHTSAGAHARSAVDPNKQRLAAGAVVGTSCASCHGTQKFAMKEALHGFHLPPRKPSGTAVIQDPNRPEPRPPAVRPPAPTRKPGFEWAGLATIGYRFLDIHGSRDRYRSDFDLEEGVRLSEANYQGRFLEGNSWLETIDIEAHDIGDPYEQVRGRFEKAGRFRVDAELRRSRMRYRASGDFHRVDRRQRATSYDLLIHLGDELEMFAGFARTNLEGYWLTNRIGNQNLTPVGSISSVTSPRRLDEDEAELGFTLGAGSTSLTLAAQYLDQRENNSWAYSQPATANPAFPESEASRATNSLEGPGARFSLAHHAGALSLDLQGRAFDRRRRTSTEGTIEGYDIARFTTTNQSVSAGAARTYLLDAGLSYELNDDLALHSEWRYLDHQEHMFFNQRDVTVHPTLSSTVTIDTLLNQRTSSRLREASAELEWQAVKGVWVSGGWGWSQEKLSLPDLSTDDDDITTGTVVEKGYLGNVVWRPTAHWSLRGHYRDFGQGGIQLTEIVDHHSRSTGGELKYTDGDAWVSLATRHRRSQNPVSDSRTNTTSYTLSSGYAVSESISSHLSYNLAQLDSRTRTSFYFNPSTTPVPTLVGFKGESHTAAGGLDWLATERLRLALLASYTTVQGDFELDLYNWSADASLQLTDRARAGVRIEQVDYHEASNPDDYSAWSAFVYISTKLSGKGW